MNIYKLTQEFGRDAANNIEAAFHHSVEGAIACLETFYYSFNNRDAEVMKEVWSAEEFIQLNNPLGGIVRGIQPIMDIYDKIFNGEAEVWVNFTDIICYESKEMVIFAGTELGELIAGDKTLPLKFRTSRVFGYSEEDVGWFQLHHHGSIDDAGLLLRYQQIIEKM